MLNEGVSKANKTFDDSLIDEGKANPYHHSIFTKDPWNIILKRIRSNFENTNFTNKILDQVAVREIINTNITEVHLKENDQSTTKAETIREHNVVKKNINIKVIDDVAKFKATGHVRTTALSDEGVFKANKYSVRR